MFNFLSSLRSRLIILILLAVIPAFGLILYSAAKHRTLTAQQVQANALRVSRIISTEQERFFENAHQLLITLSGLPQIRKTNGAACAKILGELLEPLYVNLAVTDRKGNILCRALRDSNALKRSGHQTVKRVIETHDFSIGELRIDPGTGKSIVDMAYPVTDSPGLLRAVVLVSLNFSWVARITAEAHLFPGAKFTLVDDDHTVLLRYPHEENWVGRAVFFDGTARLDLSKQGEGTVEGLGPDRVQRLFAFSPAKNRFGQKTVYAGIDLPSALAFADANRILWQNLTTLGILSALTLLGAWFGTDLFVLRRIRDLVRATRQVAIGNLSVRTRLPHGKSELGQLARAFNDLAQTLETREAEAEASTTQIEAQRQRQTALYETNLAMTSTLNLMSVLTTLLEKIARMYPRCSAAVTWVNMQTGEMETIAQHGPGRQRSDKIAAAETSLPKIVLSTKSPLILPNAQIDPRTGSLEFFRANRFVSYVGVPMVVKGEASEVLSLYSPEVLSPSPEEVNFLMALANQAAIAIDNSRLYEQTKNQAAALERSNRIKDEFLGVMSHELRTPLNVIMNYAEAMRMGTFGKLGGKQQQGTEKIRMQAEHLLELINGILEITKIETETLSLQKEQIDLKRFLNEMRTDYIIPIDKDVVLEWNYAPELPAIVGDWLKLKQILNNLINNAIKFTEQGTITISVLFVDEGNAVEIRVADTGPGIPEDLIPEIFDKFRQIDSTTTRSHSGAGLGLYIVKTFTELWGGTVRVKSELGVGSTFFVRLPVEASAERCGGEGHTAEVYHESWN